MKTRADQLLVTRKLVSSRTEAQALILAGQIYTPLGRVEKSGQLLDEDVEIGIKEKLKFVSRGGLKLDPVIEKLGIDVRGKVCLDVGASTGGFTDCLLKRGAEKVYAIDVGYGQFHWTLRKDPRIVLFERSNFRYFDRGKIEDAIDFAVVDVSFISLTKILPKLKEFLKERGEALVLVKPQFELSPGEVKKGVVRSEELREKAVAKIEGEAAGLGFKIWGKEKSPLLGPKGNQEFFLHLSI